MREIIQLSVLCLFISLIGCRSDYQENAVVKVAQINDKHLLSIQEVTAFLDTQESITLIEVSKAANYADKHLPNALHFWRPDYENKADFEYGGMIASKAQMEAILSEKGILPSDKIVLYDTKGSCDAIRLFWILNMYGHHNVFVMDGGKVAWEQAALPFTTALPKQKPSLYRFQAEENRSKYATIEEVKAAILDTNSILLDTRELEEYRGEPYISKGKIHPYKKGAFTHGCIPTAIHLNWSDAVDLNGDHCIKSLKDLKYNFERAGITPDKEIIAYCQSGVRSMHSTYILTEILGYPNVKNYDGSWIEWSYEYAQNKTVEVERLTSDSVYKDKWNQFENELRK